MLISIAIAFEQSSDLLPINCLCLVIKDQVAKQRSKLSKHVAFTMGCQNNKPEPYKYQSVKGMFQNL